ncbi:MAG TPA: SDR family oxidoreductase [Candidatus Sulfomarinibacteraceae bacterium]|nr:SDR family oxidoreductase [Candidatus Sulfomarinibacteraceae bacterium]
MDMLTRDSLDLAGRVAVVTGGGTGIGRGIALALAAAGARVVINGRRKEPLQTVVTEIRTADGEALAVTGDVSQEADVQSVLGATEDAYGPPTILINNAGIGGGGPIHNHDVAEWDKVMAVNLRGPFLMARAVLPHMRRLQQGHIVNISSESAMEYYPGNGAYGVAKHALNALGEYIQRENQELGIRVDTICPGMVVTEMTENNRALNHDKCLYPEDVADLVMWLLTRRPNLKIGRPILIQTMLNPWQ